ncbi:MAG: hypothetical protein JST54_33450 [Deltaproteobacteria bacterium]|nr:hypothetical protein [Deltaproteobacteria bacterium]
MKALLLLAVLAASPAPATDPAALEVRAAEQVNAAFVAAKLVPPMRDPGLSLAARDLATQLAAGKLDKSRLSDAVPAAISRAGAWDPAPRTLMLAGSAAEPLLQYLRAQPSLTEDRPDVMGVGIASSAGKLTLLVLFAQRYAELKPFPRELPVGGQGALDVTLKGKLGSPQLVLTGPDGHAETSTDAAASGQRLTAPIRFAQQGRYTIEVVGRDASGPRVAAIFGVVVGNAKDQADIDDPPEPADPMAKIDAVLEHINKVRARKHLPPLEHDHDLDVVALDHSVDMAKNHYFAHVSPTQGDLHARLQNRAAYVRAGENLGEAGGALAAERAIEASPAHLENTLDPQFTRVGLALFPNQHAGGEVTLLLTEIFVTPPPKMDDPATAIAEAVNRARVGRKLPALARDGILDRVAREHLKLMIGDGMPGGERDAQDAALEADPALQAVAVDLFVGSVPDDALRSRNALSGGFNRVGVAAQVVNNKRYGSDRLWICVLYGDVGAGR